MHHALRRGRSLILLLLAALLTGCLALPQTGLFAFRLAVTSLGVEEVRIGPYSVNAGLDTSDMTRLLASSLGAGSLPVQATLAMGLGLPAGMPAVEMSGFRWTLDMPGVDPVQGQYQQDVTLTPGDDANLRLPVAFDILATDTQRMTPMIELASQLASQGELPPGSELAITPGDLRGLGMTLPSGLLTPTIRLNVGADGQLIPQR
ncbi:MULTISPECIES: hypothetical protein [Halomonadaceae]|jgi:hypothetical protein|uniref:Uncharacterized protein n=1 Tax=Vreelandella hamiltonii TaxID=502829 RepID=A0A8H9ILE3_9GAMM|nr:MULTISPECIES: hypothetical protein [Halomonas]ATH77731.1 hypothetical protein CLM76_09075 [Halomonas hydrothermalis]KHJ50842.1 hypothetical protein PZ78_11280 [Halomonas hydrothermalis]MDM7483065.1 hypothetical protein [Halomonas sp.]UDM06658.1 hypothetical protein LG409_14970 [Halomonas sp. NyZ770]GHD55307.1 hypothetical protein GCM10007157_04890 [Halomonas hamiltonii]